MKKDRDNNNKVRYILSLSRSNLIIFSFKQTDDVENGEEMVETANENLNEVMEDINKDSQEGTLAALRAKHNSNMAELGEQIDSITKSKAKVEKKKTSEAEIRSKAREAALARMEGEVGSRRL